MTYEHNIIPRKIIPEIESETIVVSVPNKPDITIRKIETEYEEEVFEEAPEIIVVNGADGEDGYTPIKGVDYFDGKDGEKGEKGKDGKTPTKTELKAFIKEMFPEDKLLEKLIKKMPKEEVDSIEIGEDQGGQWISKNGKKMYIKKQFSVGAGMSTGVYDFIALRDAPDSYAGQAGKFPRVKATEDGLEFADVATATPTLQEVTDVGATTTVESTFSTGLITPQLKASTSAGLSLKSNSGTTIGLLGAGGGAGVTWYGGNNFNTVTASRVAQFSASKTLESSSVTNTELGYVSGVTSAIQTQLNAKQVTLVSGTNIKTINSTSLLGSGNISISASPAGSNTQIQFNNSSAFGADSLFNFDSTKKSFGVGLSGALEATGHFKSDTAQTLPDITVVSVTSTQFTLPIAPTTVNYTAVMPDVSQPTISGYATNSGSGGYSPSDVVDYIVTAGYDNGSTIYWGVASGATTGISDFNSFDISVSIGAVGSQNFTPNVWSLSRQVNSAGYNDYQRFTSSSFNDANSGWSSGTDSFSTYADDFLANGTTYTIDYYGTKQSPIPTTIVSGLYNANYADGGAGNAYKLQIDVSGGDVSPETRINWNNTHTYSTASSTFTLSPSMLVAGSPVIAPNTYGYLSNGSTLNRSYDFYNYQATPILYSVTPYNSTTTDPNDGNYYYNIISFTSTTGYAKVKRDTAVAQIASGTFYDDAITAFGASLTVTPTSSYQPSGLFESHGSSSSDPATLVLRSLDGGFTRQEFRSSSDQLVGAIDTTSTALNLYGNGTAKIQIGNTAIRTDVGAYTIYSTSNGYIYHNSSERIQWEQYGVRINGANTGYLSGLEIQAPTNGYPTVAIKLVSGSTQPLTNYFNASNVILSSINYQGYFNMVAATASTLAGWNASKNLVSFSLGSTLSLSGTTLSLNLTNANTWTALQTTRIVTKQAQWEYDGSNYANLTVGSTGLSTFDAVGTGAEFRFSDKVSIGATHTSYSLFNVYGVGATWSYARSMSSPNVSHGMTADFPDNVYAVDKMCETTKGGYSMVGITDAGNESPMQLWGVLGSTTPIEAAIRFRGSKKNGTSIQNIGSTELLFAFVKGNLDQVMTIMGNGDTTIYGNLTLGTAGNKLNITEGTNGSVGRATLVAGTVVVSTTAVTANSIILLTRQTVAGTPGTSVDVTARTAGTSFTITSNGSVLDTSVVGWVIIN